MDQSTTHVQKWQMQAIETQEAVLLLLSMDLDSFTKYQYQCGIAYLQWRYPVDEKARHILERSKIFWNWFKFVWLQYDISFLSYKRSLMECSRETIIQAYEGLHDPQAMAIDTRPNAVVLEELNPKKSSIC